MTGWIFFLLSALANAYLVVLLKDAYRRLETQREARKSADELIAHYRKWYGNISTANGKLYSQIVGLRQRINELGHLAAEIGCKAAAPLSALLLAFVLSGSASAQQVSPPPEDAGRPWLVVITHKTPGPQEQMLLDLVARDENLAAIRKQCQYAHYDNENPLYTQRYAKSFGQKPLPVVLLQRADGGVLYLASGDNVPDSGRELFDQMKYYSSLAPTRDSRDSVGHYGAPNYSPYTDTRPFSQCPGPYCPNPGPRCPDGDTCPIVPGVPNLNPFDGGGGLHLPDSTEHLHRRPLADTASGLFYLAVAGFAVLCLFVGCCVIAIAIASWAATRPPKS
ncbi:MAG: hypothetical protein ACTHK7_08180 [Aureliella sp.]